MFASGREPTKRATAGRADSVCGLATLRCGDPQSASPDGLFAAAELHSARRERRGDDLGRYSGSLRLEHRNPPQRAWIAGVGERGGMKQRCIVPDDDIADAVLERI